MPHHFGVSSIYLNIVFSQTIGLIEPKFHKKTSYDKVAKMYTKYLGHMTKMTAMPIYGKNPLKIFFSRSENQKASDLETWNVALGMWGLPSLFK